MIINYRWLLEDMFGYPKEVTATMTDEECREKFDQETIAILGDFNER